MTWPGGCQLGRSRCRYQSLSTSVATPPATAAAAVAAPVPRNAFAVMIGTLPTCPAGNPGREPGAGPCRPGPRRAGRPPAPCRTVIAGLAPNVMVRPPDGGDLLVVLGNYRELFAAIAGCAAALTGLLFVAMSVAPAARRGVIQQVRAAAALLAFTNALTVSVFGLVPITTSRTPR